MPKGAAKPRKRGSIRRRANSLQVLVYAGIDPLTVEPTAVRVRVRPPYPGRSLGAGGGTDQLRGVRLGVRRGRAVTGQRVCRVLITGSRTWTDTAVIRTALAAVWHPDIVLVSGACPRGADRLCESCWTAWGGQVERWPADWTHQGRAAGYRRNQQVASWKCCKCGT